MCKYIPAKATYEHFPSAVIKHLISFHAVKHCDTTLFISGHTKKTVRKVFLENPGMLADVGVGIMTEDALSSVEEFTCRLMVKIFPRRSTDGGFLTICYCLRTIGYCFLEIFVGGQGLDGGDPPLGKTLMVLAKQNL